MNQGSHCPRINLKTQCMIFLKPSISEQVQIISPPNALAGPQPYTQNYPPYGNGYGSGPGGYGLGDLPPGYGSLPAPTGRANDYERYIPSRSNTIKSEPNVNRVKRGKLNT